MPSFFWIGGFKVKSWRIVVALLLCLVLVGLTACGGGGGPEVQQQRVEVTRGDIVLSVTAEGNLSLPWHRELTFGTSGTIIEINVNEDDSVVKGQMLASLDTTSLEQEVTTAEQEVTTAEHGVTTAEHGVKTEELDIKTVEMDLESAANSLAQLTTPYPFLTFAFVLPESLGEVRIAENKIKEAREELVLGLEGEPYDMAKMKESLRLAQERLAEAESKLAAGLGQGVVPSETYWTIRAAQIVVDKAQIAVDKAKNDLDEAKNDLDEAKNDLDKAKNDLDKAKTDLEKTVILAPFGGVISAVNVKEGDKLSSVNYATTTIIEIIDPTIIRLKAKLDEIDIPSVELNQRAVIEVDALPELQLEGEVAYINPVSIEESDVVLYEVTIDFDVPQGSGLKSGMSATAELVVDERSNILLVPNRTIKNDDEGNPVVEVMVDEQIQEQSVVVGISDGYQTEIVAGLHEGELVVIETSAKPEPSGGFFFGD